MIFEKGLNTFIFPLGVFSKKASVRLNLRVVESGVGEFCIIIPAVVEEKIAKVQVDFHNHLRDGELKVSEASLEIIDEGKLTVQWSDTVDQVNEKVSLHRMVSPEEEGDSTEPDYDVDSKDDVGFSFPLRERGPEGKITVDAQGNPQGISFSGGGMPLSELASRSKVLKKETQEVVSPVTEVINKSKERMQRDNTPLTKEERENLISTCLLRL